MLTGEHTIVSSLEEITKLGLRNKRGNTISRTAAHEFFRSIFYTGLFDYAGERYQGKHQPMITMAEYNRVQETIDGRARKHVKKNNLYFMKILRCGECGASITADRQLKRYKNGKTQGFLYARCTKRMGKCSQPYLNATELDKQVKGFIKNLEISDSLVKLIRVGLKRRNKAEFDFERTLRTKQTKLLQAIMDEKKQVYGMMIDGLISKKDYQLEKSRLLTQEKQTRESLQGNPLGPWTKTMEEVLSFASNATKIFEYGNEDTRRMVLRVLCSNLYLKDKRVYIKAKNAFLVLKEAEKGLNNKLTTFEPKKMPIDGEISSASKSQSSLELSSVLSSNLINYITPELEHQLFLLKDKMGIEDFRHQYAYAS